MKQRPKVIAVFQVNMTDTDFDAVSRLLGVSKPDSTVVMGKMGLWSISGESPPGAGMNLTIQRILDRMTPAKEPWEAVNKHHAGLQMMCRVALQRSGEIDVLVPPLLSELGWRNISLGIELRYEDAGC